MESNIVFKHKSEHNDKSMQTIQKISYVKHY